MSDILRRIDRPGSIERPDAPARARALRDSTRRRVPSDQERERKHGTQHGHQPHDEARADEPVTGAYDDHGRRDSDGPDDGGGAGHPHIDIVV